MKIRKNISSDKYMEKVYADFPEWRFEIYGDGPDYNKYVRLVELNNIENLFLKVL